MNSGNFMQDKLTYREILAQPPYFINYTQVRYGQGEGSKRPPGHDPRPSSANESETSMPILNGITSNQRAVDGNSFM
jgi:hypothetical protein